MSNPKIKDEIQIVGTREMKGIKVAVWIEFRRYPFFGTQFHPEKIYIDDPKYDEQFNRKKRNVSKRFAQLFAKYVPAVSTRQMRMEGMNLRVVLLSGIQYFDKIMLFTSPK